MDVRGEQGEVGKIPAVERKFHDLLRVDHLALFARVGFEYSGRAVYLDELIRSADLEADIDTLAGIYVDADITGSEFRESFVFDSHSVETDLDIEEVVVAAVVGNNLIFDAGFLACESNRGFRNGGAGGILYGAENLSGLELADQ